MPKVPRYNNSKEYMEFDAGDETVCGRCYKSRGAVTWSPAFGAWLDADCRDNVTRFTLGYDTTASSTRFPQGLGVLADDPCGSPDDDMNNGTEEGREDVRV